MQFLITLLRIDYQSRVIVYTNESLPVRKMLTQLKVMCKRRNPMQPVFTSSLHLWTADIRSFINMFVQITYSHDFSCVNMYMYFQFGSQLCLLLLNNQSSEHAIAKSCSPQEVYFAYWNYLVHLLVELFLQHMNNWLLSSNEEMCEKTGLRVNTLY